jgi:glycosyltransferase involved in cell wall biosynthesis
LKKRVLSICNDGEYFLRHRRGVSDALAQAGHPASVLAGGRPIPEAAIGGWRYRHVPISRFSFNPWSDARLAFVTAKEILRRKPDAVHLMTLKPTVVGGLVALAIRRLTGRPSRILVTIPGLGRLMSPGSGMRSRSAGAARWLIQRCIRLLSASRGVAFTFETDHDRDVWLGPGWIKAENSFVIHGAGVDASRFYPSMKPRPDGPVRVLFASRLLRSKGLEEFIAAARLLSPRADVEFLVAGMIEPNDPDGYPVDRLEAEKALTFLGEIGDMPNLLRSVDLVCLPSRYGEGIPRILIEAAATGLPSVATDLGGCRRIVLDGRTGSLIPVEAPPRMAADLARAIEAYLDAPGLLRRHGRAARAHFDEGAFSERIVIDRFVELLTQDP